MNLTDGTLLAYWFSAIQALLPQLFAVIIVWLVALRMKYFRRAIQQVHTKKRYKFMMMLLFGLFAIYGTHKGIPVNLFNIGYLEIPSHVPESLSQWQAIITFRDTWVFVAGFQGGLWVGLGAGLIAGIERYFLGGFAAGGTALATIMLGLYSGAIFHYRPQWTKTAPQLLTVVLMGTVFMHLILLLTVKPIADALLLIKLVSIPTTVLSIAGCVLFIWLMSDLDRDHQAQLLQQAELRVLRAQIDPHFLNNTLNDITGIIESNPVEGVHYVCELAEFFNHTREYAMLNTINLELELEQLQRFLSFKRLSYGDRLQVDFKVPQALFFTPVLSGCLLTIVENSLKHAFQGKLPPYQLFIRAEKQGENLMLSVRDNGRGFSTDLFNQLGNRPINAKHNGGGVALFQLKQRLYLIFEDKADLSFSNADGAVIRLIHPITQSTEA